MATKTNTDGSIQYLILGESGINPAVDLPAAGGAYNTGDGDWHWTAANIVKARSYDPLFEINIKDNKADKKLKKALTNEEVSSYSAGMDGQANPTAIWGRETGTSTPPWLPGNSLGIPSGQNVYGAYGQWAHQSAGVISVNVSSGTPGDPTDPPVYGTPTNRMTHAVLDGAGTVNGFSSPLEGYGVTIGVIDRGAPAAWIDAQDPTVSRFKPMLHPECHYWNPADPNNPAAAEGTPGTGGIIPINLSDNPYLAGAVQGLDVSPNCHGTSVTGILAADVNKANGVTTGNSNDTDANPGDLLRGRSRGLTPKAKIICYRIGDPGSTDWAAEFEAMYLAQAVHGVKVLNYSRMWWQLTGKNSSEQAQDLPGYKGETMFDLMSRAQQALEANDVLFVNSYGNDGVDFSDPYIPTSWRSVKSAGWYGADPRNNGQIYNVVTVTPSSFVIAGHGPRDYNPIGNLDLAAYDPNVNQLRTNNLQRPYLYYNPDFETAQSGSYGPAVRLSAPGCGGAGIHPTIDDSGIQSIRNFAYTLWPFRTIDVQFGVPTPIIGIDIGYHNYIGGLSMAIPYTVGTAALCIERYMRGNATTPGDISTGTAPSVYDLRNFLINGAVDKSGPTTEYHFHCTDGADGKRGWYLEEEFVYDEAGDDYRCGHGHLRTDRSVIIAGGGTP